MHTAYVALGGDGCDQGCRVVSIGCSPVFRFHSGWIPYGPRFHCSMSEMFIQHHLSTQTFSPVEHWVHWFKTLKIDGKQDTGIFTSTRRSRTSIQQSKFRQKTNKPVFPVFSPNVTFFVTCFQFTIFVGSRFCRRHVRVFVWILNCRKCEAEHWCWLLTSLFTWSRHAHWSVFFNTQHHPTYNEWSWFSEEIARYFSHLITDANSCLMWFPLLPFVLITNDVRATTIGTYQPHKNQQQSGQW